MKKIIQRLLLVLLFTSPTLSFSEEIKVSGFVPKFGFPKTDQIISYAANDDGAYQKGMPATGIAHYQDNGDGTITDNATGLMWVQDPSLCGGYVYPNTWATDPDVPNTMTWTNAITECEALDYAGHNDWRLPSIKELMSIADYSIVNPPADPIFRHSEAGHYYSSTTVASDTDRAWHMQFGYDWVGNHKKTDPIFVRPVRGGS